MKYTQKTFTVPGSAGQKAECDRVGHTEPDRHGKCLRCGERLACLIPSVASERGRH